MSKPVTNEEVEDVLSSIRRLVSEDKRPLAGLRSAPTGPSAQPASPVADEKAEKLVLTPALRVPQAPPEAQDEGPLDLGLVARQTWIGRDPSEKPQSVAQQGTLDDADIAETPQDTAMDPKERALNDLDALVQETLAGKVSTDAEDASTDTQAVNEAPDDWSDLVPDHGDSPDEAYAAHQEQDEERDRHWNIEFGDVHAEWSDEDGSSLVGQPTDEHADPVLTGDGVALDKTVPLTAKIAALETAIGAIRQDWEPDGAGDDDYAGAPAAAMAWEDDIDLDATGSPLNDHPQQDLDHERSKTPADEADSEATAGLASDDGLMDEETLRDLVSEIVRSELQGALGERITRNVRKLVRREIHRALTAQEME
ncbi:hypothetical protein [uncultured Sulfitobacter sp.]|uniref:hypothetical protein n=1 Tax=uncultured Sulfitobacter sp. TaxID=191468 RepID=UPI00261529CB|nr:hypothetical protein [uncultured Sulfitobacter sp.]